VGVAVKSGDNKKARKEGKARKKKGGNISPF
jgi:hypothetical protein